jgi:plasmid stabilization system protein ParE
VARRVVFRPQAEDELQETRDWYERRQAGLGRAFAQAVDDMVGQISENPLSYQRVHGQTRRAVLRRFPYAIYFRVADENIVVQAVHGRQHPARWQTRR